MKLSRLSNHSIFPVFTGIVFLNLITACTESRIKRYSDLIQPSVGSGNKREISKLLGAPAFCRENAKLETCEYRTDRGRNESIPYVHQKSPGMAPDLTPFEHFDVIHVSYDSSGIVQAWEPIVLPEP